VKDLDRRLAALGRVEIDRDLTRLERDVWARIDARATLRPMPRRLAAALCLGAAVLASTAGAGVAAASAGAKGEIVSAQAPFAHAVLLSN